MILPALCLCPMRAAAQLSVFGSSLTNNAQTQSNNFESALSRLQGQVGTPFLGTSLGHTGGSRGLYTPNGPPLQEVGPFQFYPHATYMGSYGNALPAQRGSNSATFVNEIAPGMLVKMGNCWAVDYTSSLYYYSNPLFQNKTDQDATLQGLTTNGEWTLGLTQNYVQINQTLQETGTQTEQQLYATVFNAALQLGTKTSLEFDFDQTFRFLDSEALVSSLREWKTTDWLNYQFYPQLSAGLGVAGGYDQLSINSDMAFEQALGRMMFHMGTRLAVTLVGGVEDREFVDTSEPSLVNPIFQAVGLWQIREGTLFSATGSRLVVPSLYSGEVNVTTSATAAIRQHIIGKLDLSVEGNYTVERFNSIVSARNNGTFPSSVSFLDEVRNDNRESLDVRLSAPYRTRLTISLFCMFIDNRSSSSTALGVNQRGLTYSGVQGGLELEYKY
jgi:hypothetical protein